MYEGRGRRHACLMTQLGDIFEDIDAILYAARPPDDIHPARPLMTEIYHT